MEVPPLFEETAHFRPFPDADEVFGLELELHIKYLLPLASVDLSHVIPDATGTIHFIQTIEPLDGVVGEGAEKHFNHFCRENWVGYRYDGNKCQLATDFQFFQLARLDAVEKPTGKQEKKIRQLSDHYATVCKGFELRKLHFQEYGALHNAWARKQKGVYSPDARVALVNRLGGPCHCGNWSEGSDFPLAESDFTDADGIEWPLAVPKTEDGRSFVFVGALSTYHYIAENPDFTSPLACDLLLFYDPVSKIAITTFDWS